MSLNSKSESSEFNNNSSEIVVITYDVDKLTSKDQEITTKYLMNCVIFDKVEGVKRCIEKHPEWKDYNDNQPLKMCIWDSCPNVAEYLIEEAGAVVNDDVYDFYPYKRKRIEYLDKLYTNSYNKYKGITYNKINDNRMKTKS